jgi:alpha-beta hydrolase superfamily lysophospholipase
MSTPIERADGFEETPAGRLYWRSWTPESPKAVLLLVHGLAEHSGRYAHVAAWFAARGYASVAIDYRGHGRSPGPRVHVDSFDAWCDDVAAGLALARREHPGLPLFVVSHSQGGLIVLLQALRRPDDRAGTVVSSPLLGVAPASRPGAILKLATKVLMRVAPRLRVANNVNPDWLSRDPAVGRAYLADPLVSRKVSAGWFRALQAALRETHERAGEWRSPLLMVASDGDRIVDANATRAWAERATVGSVRIWKDLRHELFNETNQEEVFAAVVAWLDERLASARTARTR